MKLISEGGLVWSVTMAQVNGTPYPAEPITLFCTAFSPGVKWEAHTFHRQDREAQFKRSLKRTVIFK